MHLCPVDGARLDRVNNGLGVHWTCPGCHGRAIGLAVARRTIAAELVNRIWQAARGCDEQGVATAAVPGVREPHGGHGGAGRDGRRRG